MTAKQEAVYNAARGLVATWARAELCGRRYAEKPRALVRPKSSRATAEVKLLEAVRATLTAG